MNFAKKRREKFKKLVLTKRERERESNPRPILLRFAPFAATLWIMFATLFAPAFAKIAFKICPF